jgi:hypothetical protein
MCTILLLAKLSGAINSAMETSRNFYYKMSAPFYNIGKRRSVQVLVDGCADSDEDCLLDMEYATMEFAKIDPEMYYFFKLHMNSLAKFDKMLQSCCTVRRETYSAILSTGELCEFVLDAENDLIYLKVPTNKLN